MSLRRRAVDGRHPALACATASGKIFVHNPHVRSAEFKDDLQFLNINRRITALAAGRLDPDATREDVLCVGTQASLLVYDVNGNRDLFFREVPDGVMSMAIGQPGTSAVPLCVVGGNCSVQGFDAEGEEQFWTVTGDMVSALALCDVDEDGQHEILVGSEDYEIRIFQNEEVISETTETERVTGLCTLRGTKYGYALANGTVGVYNRNNRMWRVKAKHQVTSIEGFDLDADGVPELISGWSNGKLEVRNERNGEVVYKDHFSSAVAAIVRADYRMDGKEEVICCGADGEVRGYLPATEDNRIGNSAAEVAREQAHKLTEEKNRLQLELSQLETQVKLAQKGETGKAYTELIPPQTQLSCEFVLNRDSSTVDVVLKTNNETVIKVAAIFADQIFESESRVVHAKNPTSELRVPIAPPKDISVDLNVKALVGQIGSEAFHVFELTRKLPKFAMYPLNDPSAVPPEIMSSVTFHLQERMSRVGLWLAAGFNIQYPAPPETIDIQFTSLRTKTPPRLVLSSKDDGLCKIMTDDMEVAGDVIQDLCQFLDVRELTSVAEFPAERAVLKAVMAEVDNFNAVRLKLSVDMADASSIVKTLVIKAEDARLMADMEAMKRHYKNLNAVNADLIMDYSRRAANHAQLIEALKHVNAMIQRAARLRVGKAKTTVVNACRAAVKANKIDAVFKIMEKGSE